MEVDKSKVFVGDVSHEKHVIIPEGIEIVDNNCVTTYKYELFERTCFGSSVRVIEIPHSLKEFSLYLWSTLAYISYHGSVDDFLKIKFAKDTIPSANHYRFEVNGQLCDMNDLFVPQYVTTISSNNASFYKTFESIHFHKGMQNISTKYINAIGKQKVYFECTLDEVLANKAFTALIKKLQSLKKTAYILDENKQYKEVDFNILPATQNKPNKTYTDRFNNTFVLNGFNELVSFGYNADEVELPEQLEVICKKVFNNSGFKKMYLNKNIKTFSRAAFVNKYKIAELYYPGSYEDFNKIYFEPGFAKRPVLESVGKLFVLNKEGKYYQVIFDRISMVEARGFSKELVDIYLSRDAALIRATCKKILLDNPGGVKSYIRYHENQLKVIVEAKFFDLSDDFRNYLLGNKVSLLMDDVIIDYAINKDTKINKVHDFVVSHYGEPVLEGNKLVKFKLDTTEFEDWQKELDDYHIAVNIDKEVKVIAKDAFKGIEGVLINYDGDVKDWFKVNLEEDSLVKDTLIRCLDGTVEYVMVDHKQRETRDLYYGYAHMGNSYRYSLQFAINSKKIWDFIRLSHLSIIAWDYFCGTPYYCDKDDDEEYCILDYHNFKMIYLCDVEAG